MNISKVIHPGTVEVYNGKFADVFCKIDYLENKLSISGVEGPLSSGNALGSCGQIGMGYAHRNPADNDKRYAHPTRIKTFAEGWNEDLWFDFLDVWKKWHLNDMTPGCEHQTGPEWESQAVTLYHYRRTKDATKKKRDAETRALSSLKSGKTFTPTNDEIRYFSLPSTIQTHESSPPCDDYEPNSPQYSGDHYNKPSETKESSWVRPDEHPLGYLGKPCPVCGYKYGTEWKKRAVPDAVLVFLDGLPDSTKKPAWV